ncbi:hypothetical protein [Gordonia sputi]|uniref:hypothetical protein n=1 Tax=Gordonia sputi TaxID=36823 RepID=UPI0036ABB8B0
MIRIAVDDLTEDLMSLDAFGSMLCGINSDGQLTHDPADAEDACVAIELRVEDDLEPQWTAVRPGDTEGRPVKSSLRSRFGVYRSLSRCLCKNVTPDFCVLAVAV